MRLFLLLLLCSLAVYCQHSHTDSPELINVEAFFPNGSFIITTINITKVKTAYANPSCPGVDPQKLREQRLEVLKIWAGRTNKDIPHLESVYQTYATEDTNEDGQVSEFLHLLGIPGSGNFGAKKVATEYAYLATDPSFAQLLSEVDSASIVWNDDDISVSYDIITNYTLYNGAIRFDGFKNRNLMYFKPCTTKVWIDTALQDPLIQRFFSSDAQGVPNELTCTSVMSSCTGANQKFATWEDCVSYYNAVDQKPQPCPGGYVANSTICYAFHARSAVFLPDIHCPHVAPDSSVCRDFCLTRGCGNCHPDAECVQTTKRDDIAATYSCKCKEGFIGDGQSCERATCSGKWECPTNYNRATCTNNTCGCLRSGGFIWDGSKPNVCECGETEEVYYYQGKPECVPKGRCRTKNQCPQDWSTINCDVLGTNSLIPFGTCLCKYGYDNPGFEYDCQCNEPKREVWSSDLQGLVCLTTCECTENYHCSSNVCKKKEGEIIGVCQGNLTK